MSDLLNTMALSSSGLKAQSTRLHYRAQECLHHLPKKGDAAGKVARG